MGTSVKCKIIKLITLKTKPTIKFDISKKSKVSKKSITLSYAAIYGWKLRTKIISTSEFQKDDSIRRIGKLSI